MTVRSGKTFWLFLTTAILLAICTAAWLVRRQHFMTASALAKQAEQISSASPKQAFDLAVRGWHIAQMAETRMALASTSAPLLEKLRGHTGPIVDVEFSADGQQMVTASKDNTARIWNT